MAILLHRFSITSRHTTNNKNFNITLNIIQPKNNKLKAYSHLSPTWKVQFYQSHLHELFHGSQATNIMSIVKPIFYKHLKIFHAQPRASKVCANTYNIENSFCLNLEANDPQNLSSYKLNIRKLYFTHSHCNKMQPYT